jgi:hypothetical protein
MFVVEIGASSGMPRWSVAPCHCERSEAISIRVDLPQSYKYGTIGSILSMG